MLLIDAMTIDLDTPQIGIIDGDAQSLSIAAASIVAKVHRDALMVDLDLLVSGLRIREAQGLRCGPPSRCLVGSRAVPDAPPLVRAGETGSEHP